MTCKNCGAEIPENETRCPKCGAPVETEPAAQIGEVAAPETPRGFSNKRNILIIAIALVVLIIGGAVTAVAVTRSGTQSAESIMTLAERYLKEEKYEQAVIEFQRVIELDPMNVDAYLNLAKAYIGLGDTEKALEVLREGLEKTGDSRLQEKIDELTKPVESLSAVQSSAVLEESKPVESTPVYGDTECLQIEEMIEAYLRGESAIDNSKLKNITGITIYGSDVAMVQCGNRHGKHYKRTWYQENKVTLIKENGEETDVLSGNIDNLREDIHFIFDIPQLDRLGIVCNQISDISPFAELTNLTCLQLWGNEISNLTPLTRLTNLETLWLTDNQISDITPLAGLTNLKILYLEENQISDITSLEGLINLKTLRLNYNQVSDITALTGLINLKTLRLRHNQISDITPLAGLTNLEGLNLSNNQVIDIAPLSGLTNLQQLFLENNQISDADITQLKEQLSNCEVMA